MRTIEMQCHRSTLAPLVQFITFSSDKKIRYIPISSFKYFSLPISRTLDPLLEAHMIPLGAFVSHYIVASCWMNSWWQHHSDKQSRCSISWAEALNTQQSNSKSIRWPVLVPSVIYPCLYRYPTTVLVLSVMFSKVPHDYSITRCDVMLVRETKNPSNHHFCAFSGVTKSLLEAATLARDHYLVQRGMF